MNKKTETYDFHAAANIFPLDEEHLSELAADIRKNGQQVSIKVLDGKIVDGRRRFLACEMAKGDPVFEDVEVADPVAYVLSLNLHRRHLSPSQLALVGAKALEVYEQQAKERQRLSQGRGQKGSDPGRNLNSETGRASDKAGESVGVSGRSVERAARVIKEGTSELVKAVEDGHISVKAAAAIATASEEEQHKAVEEANKPRAERRQVISEDSEPTGEIKGVGVFRANEAINCLIRIPKKDPLRKRGFQIVSDFIKDNK